MRSETLKARLSVTLTLAIVFVVITAIGYRIIDTIFFTYARGSITIKTYQNQEQTIQLTQCRMVTDANNIRQLLISDDYDNGVQIITSSHLQTSIIPMLNKQDLSEAKTCTIHKSTLRIVDLYVSGKSSVAQSWQGSIDADCAFPKGNIHIVANVHACK